MYSSGEMFGSFESALDECLVDDNLCGNICQFAFLSKFYLLSHWLEVPLHAIDAH